MSGQALGESLYKHIVKHGMEISLFSSSDVTQSADTERLRPGLALRSTCACSTKHLLL